MRQLSEELTTAEDWERELLNKEQEVHSRRIRSFLLPQIQLFPFLSGGKYGPRTVKKKEKDIESKVFVVFLIVLVF